MLSVEYIGDLPTFVVTVEDDHSHVTNGIVTHNTGRLSAKDPAFQTMPNKTKWENRITEVLTKRGWVLFSELAEGETVATLKPDFGIMEFHVPEEIAKQDYSGPVIRINGVSTDLLVTPNHDLWLRKRRSVSYSKVKAGAYNGKSVVMTSSAPAEGEHLLEVPIPRYRKRLGAPEGEVMIPADLMLNFIGLYAGDGCVPADINQGYSIRLGARSEEKVHAFTEALCELSGALQGQEVRSYALAGGGSSVELADKALAIWLRENVGLGAALKRLPVWCLQLNAEQSQILLGGLFMSDGFRCPNRKAWAYRTASQGLADDVQIVALRTDSRATVVEEAKGGYWRVNIVPNKQEIVVQDVHTEYYNGVVYCIRVHNHLVITRRNGKVVVNGNSMFEKHSECCEERVRRAFRMPPIFVGQS